jgi:mRNA interferase RelE/StbE
VSDEAYRLVMSPAARRPVTEGPPIGLPMAVAAAVVEFITGPLLNRPYVVGKPLANELAGYYSARRGSYRVVYNIDKRSRAVHVLRIDHRADVYHS